MSSSSRLMRVQLPIAAVLVACGGGGGGGEAGTASAGEVVARPKWNIEGINPPRMELDNSFDFPQPTASAGSVHHVTQACNGLSGTELVLRFAVGGATGVKIVPRNFPNSPSLLSLFFQRRGDNMTGAGEFEAYRWYSPNMIVGIKPGEWELRTRFDANWTAVMTSSRANNLSGFQAAMANAARVGFVLGGGDGRAHGVYATGPAHLIIREFKVV